ncbi:MAG: sugar phosphate isomerase/epimerase family protein [Tepidisphaeraceae bacterium]
MLALAASAAATLAVSPFPRALIAAEVTSAPSTVPVTASARNKRFKVAGDDLFLNNRRQNLQAFTIAQKAGLDGVQVDMGRMPGGKELINKLREPQLREQFLAESKHTGVEIASLAWFAMYARPFAVLPIAVESAHEWIDTMSKMNVKLGFMPLMSKDGTLREPEHAEVWTKSVEVFKRVAPAAEKAGVVLGVESNLDGDGYKKFLDAVGSPAVQAFYNPGVGLENKFDVYADIKALGKDRICALHLEQGSVPPEDFERRLGDGLIDFKKLREVLLEIEWGGWMSIARSRLKGTTSADTNMSANAKFVHEMFPE